MRTRLLAAAVGLAACLGTVFPIRPSAAAIDLPPGFQVDHYVEGLDEPIAMVFAPDGRLFVAEKAGRVRVVMPGGVLVRRPFIEVRVDSTKDRGLASLALDPGFAHNGFVYLYYVRPGNGGGLVIRLTRVRVGSSDPNVADAASEVKLLEIPYDSDIRYGGLLQFGADRMLYVGVGDSSHGERSADLGDLRGKILRLDTSRYPKIIPQDNPFVGRRGARGEIWAYGVRNTFSGAILPGTNTLYVNDVGQDSWEEVNQIVRGGNFGWPATEGPTRARGVKPPIYAYPHQGSAAITGGAFYTASQFPAEYRGSYFFSDYAMGFIRRLTAGPNPRMVRFGQQLPHPVRLTVGPDGSLYVLCVVGGVDDPASRMPIYRISYVGDANRPPLAAAEADPASGLAPLTVSFSGAGSTDPDGDALTYAWDFGDGAAGSGREVTHTYARNGVYPVRLTVQDGRGGSGVLAEPLVVTVGNEPPTGTILTPDAALRYTAGDTVTFTGTAVDPQQGDLPASAFTWSFMFLHDTHTHPFIAPVAGVKSGSFEVPLTGETAANQGYRIFLTVTDSGGLQHTSSVDVRPRTAPLRLTSDVAGITVDLEGVPQGTPYTAAAVVGMRRDLEAPERQKVAGREYAFVSWSDGGPRKRTVTIPPGGVSLEARYRLVTRARRNSRR